MASQNQGTRIRSALTQTPIRYVARRSELIASTRGLARTPALWSPSSTGVSTPDGIIYLTPHHTTVADSIQALGAIVTTSTSVPPCSPSWLIKTRAGSTWSGPGRERRDFSVWTWS
ncbi:hypothetical protein IG631_01984 [Alternaria alternata]|nr:hypothetical protein IG631_01984 [Alternaria alternata]